MAYVKWAIILIFWGSVGGLLHYVLPQHDTVRIVGTYEERQELNDWTRIFWAVPDDQSANLINRDVPFIQAIRPDGSNIVYRSEDTGWGWPFYFKFDTANLYTEAADLVSTKTDPEWVSVLHYGWRNEFLSAFPNAISVKAVDSPDYSPIPWFNIIFLTILFAIVWAIWVRWRRFRIARIDPVVEGVEDSLYEAGEVISEKKGRFSKWLGTWKKK